MISWLATVIILIAIAAGVGILMSFIYNLVSIPEQSRRDMDCLTVSQMDCRDMSAKEVLQEIATTRASKKKICSSFVFADTAEDGIVDVGYAVGYGKDKAGAPAKRQISFIVKSIEPSEEDLEETVSYMDRMLRIMSETKEIPASSPVLDSKAARYIA